MGCSNKRLWEEEFRGGYVSDKVAKIHETSNKELWIKNYYWKENREIHDSETDRTIENRRKGYKHRLFPLLCLF